MFPKAHLASHSRMSGSRWVTTLFCLSESLRPLFFFYSSSVYSCHLFLISSTSVRSLWFLSFIGPIPTLLSPIVLKRSLVLPILLFSFISLHFSFKKALSLLAFLRNSVFNWGYLSLSSLRFCFSSFLSYLWIHLRQALYFLTFLSFGMVLFTASCTMIIDSVHSFLGTLSTRYNPLNIFVTSTVQA